jgi:hypothetical protein
VSRAAIALLLTAVGVKMSPIAAAQAVTPSEREALVRLRTDRGGTAQDIDGLLRRVEDAAARGLPAAPLTSKIREGLAKGHSPQRIEPVIQQMAVNLETADRLLRELGPAGADQSASVALLAESLGSGVSADEVRGIVRLSAASATTTNSNRALNADRLAGAAKGLSFIKDARLPVSEGTAVIVEAVRQGFRSHEMLDLGRGIKLREADYHAGRASLQALREAIARGERPEQLFRDPRPEAPARPAAARPESVDRPERPVRPEPPARPEPVERPTRPGGSIR